MVTRNYICWCHKNDFMLNIYLLQRKIKMSSKKKKPLSEIKLCSDELYQKWSFWKNIFNEIDIYIKTKP